MIFSYKAIRVHWDKTVKAYEAGNKAEAFNSLESTLIFTIGQLCDEEKMKNHVHSFEGLIHQVPAKYMEAEWYKSLYAYKDVISQHINERCMHKPVTVTDENLNILMTAAEQMLMDAVGFIVPKFNIVEA